MSFKRVAVGGSFDVLHKGHRALLDKAFGASEYVIIGLTTNKLAGKDVAVYGERKRALEAFLKHKGQYKIVELNDPLGDAATDREIDAIIVSEETAPGALEINEARKRRGLKALKIIQIPLVLAKDERRISSTRIKSGEIDGEGRVLLGHK
ncbi:MAG: pantetheine-phosphate adenylyltransferase [Candidatus Hydrothermarchaeaceae archaeon]